MSTYAYCTSDISWGETCFILTVQVMVKHIFSPESLVTGTRTVIP